MKIRNDRIVLWAHLVSEHAMIIDLNFPEDELEDIHQQEHEGPCTIRDHDVKSREYSLRKLGAVLSESEE